MLISEVLHRPSDTNNKIYCRPLPRDYLFSKRQQEILCNAGRNDGMESMFHFGSHT